MLLTPEYDFDAAHAELRRRIGTPLKAIARQSVRVWFNRTRLDELLAEAFPTLDRCQLLFAIDSDGRQVSSNVEASRVVTETYGQDLSRRPYSISLRVLKSAGFHGPFVCDTYVSSATGRPCVTVMYGVTLGSAHLGYIAADFDPAGLPAD